MKNEWSSLWTRNNSVLGEALKGTTGSVEKAMVICVAWARHGGDLGGWSHGEEYEADEARGRYEMLIGSGQQRQNGSTGSAVAWRRVLWLNASHTTFNKTRMRAAWPAPCSLCFQNAHTCSTQVACSGKQDVCIEIQHSTLTCVALDIFATQLRKA